MTWAEDVAKIKGPGDLDRFTHHKVGDNCVAGVGDPVESDRIVQIAFVQAPQVPRSGGFGKGGPTTEGAVVIFFASGEVGSSIVSIHPKS